MKDLSLLLRSVLDQKKHKKTKTEVYRNIYWENSLFLTFYTILRACNWTLHETSHVSQIWSKNLKYLFFKDKSDSQQGSEGGQCKNTQNLWKTEKRISDRSDRGI